MADCWECDYLECEITELKEEIHNLQAQLMACQVERDAALHTLRHEQALRDHAEAHVEHLKESNG